MSQQIPSNTQAITTSWLDLVRVVRDMPLQCLIALGVCSSASVVQVMFGSVTNSGASQSVRGLGIHLVLSLAEAFLLTPLLIAVHRLIILGERPTGYAVAPGQPRFTRFFGWSVALQLAAFLATLGPASLVVDAALQIIILLVLGVMAIVILTRAVLLFPALAVDAPGANWFNSWADTRGHGYDIFLILLGAFVPLFVLTWFIALLVFEPQPDWGAGARTLSLAAPYALTSWGSSILAVIVASRLYTRLADRLKQG